MFKKEDFSPPRQKTFRKKSLQHAFNCVDGNSEADPLGLGGHGGIDPDYFPFQIEKGPAVVSGVNGGVGLQQVFVARFSTCTGRPLALTTPTVTEDLQGRGDGKIISTFFLFDVKLNFGIFSKGVGPCAFQ